MTTMKFKSFLAALIFVAMITAVVEAKAQSYRVESVVDIQATVPVPQFAIVDGIVGMEGNGPLQGQAKQAGVLLFGDDLVATDATAARLMNIEPSRVRYLAMADRFLGNVALERITQIGESLEAVQQNFAIIDRLTHLRATERSTAS